MGRKKRKGLELKPFCYYCDREFDDEKVLLLHQKARHFKCPQCNRKLDTATGLVVHLLQVHKESLTRVPNANKERDGPELVIHGMSGMPPEIIMEKQRKLAEERGMNRPARGAHTIFGSGLFGAGGLAPFSRKLSSSNLLDNYAAEIMQMMPNMMMGNGFWNPSGANMSIVPGMNSALLDSMLTGTGFGGSQMPSDANAMMDISGGVSKVVCTNPLQYNPSAFGMDKQQQQQSTSLLNLLPGAYPVEKMTAPKPQNGVLVYDDDFTSVEEKRAALPKYNYRLPVVIAPLS